MPLTNQGHSLCWLCYCLDALLLVIRLHLPLVSLPCSSIRNPFISGYLTRMIQIAKPYPILPTPKIFICNFPCAILMHENQLVAITNEWFNQSQVRIVVNVKFHLLQDMFVEISCVWNVICWINLNPSESSVWIWIHQACESESIKRQSDLWCMIWLLRSA